MKKLALRVRIVAAGGVVACALVTACGWSPSRPFDREAPQVNEAISQLDAGDARAASALLSDYLSTGACSDGNLGTPPRVKERSNGSFDLGLALFKIAEALGHRFGDEETDSGTVGALPSAPTANEKPSGLRAEQVECALKIVRAIATDPDQPIDLRARARYLEGNLLFLNANYEEAVRAYDAALELAPGIPDGGPLGASDARPWAADPVGLDAAWNRAIALRRIEDKKDAGNDGGNDASQDASADGGGDGGNQGKDGGKDDKDGGGKDDKDGGGKNDPQDGGKDAAGNDKKDDDQNKPKPNEGKDAGAPPPSRQNQDDRMLDQLENAPTVQGEAAKRAAQKRRGTRGMADK